MCDANHPYLRRKGIPALEGIRQARTVRCLFPFWIPQIICKVCNASTLMEPSVSSLAARYLEDNSSFRAAGKADSHLRSFATGASIHLPLAGRSMWLSPPTICPWSPNRQETDSQTGQSFICGDNDEAGRKRGEEAAGLANAQLLFPHFTDDNGTDFNDLHQIEGIEPSARNWKWR